MRALLVGEAWGETEARFEHAFVGASGIEFARMLAEAQLCAELRASRPSPLDMIAHWKRAAQQGVALANVFNARPPHNQLEHFFTTRDASDAVLELPPLKIKVGTSVRQMYLRREMLPHLVRLWEHIREAKPNLIVALGNTACWATLRKANITSIRGTIEWAGEPLNVKVLPTFHPAAILRQWNMRATVVADLGKARVECEFPEIRRSERWGTLAPSLREIEEWAGRPAERYSVDIETHGGMITMIAFARTPSDTLCIPFMDDSRAEGGAYRCADWNFWPSTEDEVRAWQLVQRLLAAPVPKLFQNGIYDLSYILRAGLRPRMCWDDSMLLHHSLYPELPKGLGFLGSVYSREIAWKTMRTKSANGDAAPQKRDE